MLRLIKLYCIVNDFKNDFIFEVIYNTIIPKTKNDFPTTLLMLTKFLNLNQINKDNLLFDIRMLIPSFIADAINSCPIDGTMEIKKFIYNTILPSSNEKLIKIRGDLEQLNKAFSKILEIMIEMKKYNYLTVFYNPSDKNLLNFKNIDKIFDENIE